MSSDNQGKSTITMITNLAVNMPNEEFGLLARWMTVEANHRRERLAASLKRGDDVVFINYSDKLTKGVVKKIGTKNALIKTENGGNMYIPLARLERAEDSRVSVDVPPLSSLPSSAPPEAVDEALAEVKSPRKRRSKKAPAATP